MEKRLRRAGCYLKREGGSHSLWINPKTGVVEAVPRHGEVKEPLAWKMPEIAGRCLKEPNVPAEQPAG